MRTMPMFRVHLTAISKPASTRVVKAGIRTNQSSATHISLKPGLRRSQRSSDRLTIFTQPHATQGTVLNKIRNALAVEPSRPGDPARAAVVLASPRHASWLTDKDFTGDLVHALHGDFDKGVGFHLVAAVVDGLCARPPSRELQEGISIHLGRLDGLLPGLWDDKHLGDADRSISHSATDPDQPSSLSILLSEKTTSRSGRVSVTLPLANTLFSNGRRSTLLASEWRRGKGFWNTAEMVRSVEKQNQVVSLANTLSFHRIEIHAPLVPITQPRKVLEGLGNIIAKVQVGEEPCPASMELQMNIPRLMEARRALDRSSPVSGAIGVWAMVYPQHMFFSEADMVRFGRTIKIAQLGTASGKLAFEMSTDQERVAWERRSVLWNAFSFGARLHKILGGGGEWGAKASLLSLDPKTSHEPQSEADELEKFMRSFNGEQGAKDAIAQPGDYVQFFVERDAIQRPPKQTVNLKATLIRDYPPIRFGCGDLHMRDIEPPDWIVSRRQHEDSEHLVSDHFGAHSTEGIYLSSSTLGPNTKMDIPGTTVTMARTDRSATGVYRPWVRPILNKLPQGGTRP